MIPTPTCRISFADWHIEIPFGIYRWSSWHPDATQAGRWHLVGEERSGSIGASSNKEAPVIATVTVEAPEGHVDLACVQGEGCTLLIRTWIDAWRIHKAADLDLPRFEVYTYQDMRWPSYLCHCKDQACLPVVDRRTRDAKRIDIPARQV